MKIREVPFLRLGGIYEQDDMDVAVSVIKDVIEKNSGFFPLPEDNVFQEELAKHEGAKFAVSTNSCGTALDVCMMASGIKEGDEVITTPLTFVCTAGTIVARGAKVVFADIDIATMNLDPKRAVEKITNNTKAIIPVHFTGLSADIDEYDKITQEYGIPVIYDSAHAVGTKYKGQPAGGRGKASCYSFQSNKNITCLGEGGAVTTNDAEFAEKVRQLKTFGYVYGKDLKVVSIGFNYRMTKVQLAVGINQLKKADRIMKQKQKAMTRMNELLDGVNGIITSPYHGEGHGSHLYVIRIDSEKTAKTRGEFRDILKNEYKIETTIHYPAVWTWDAFRDLGYNGEGCPIAERVCREVISLPIFPSTTEDDMQYMAWAIQETIKK